MGYRLYLSPSTQEHNIGAGSYGTEEKRANEITDKLEPLLKQTSKFDIFRNNPLMTLKEVVKDSNSLAIDAHVAIHTNAGGGSARGLEIWHCEGSKNGKKIADLVYAELSPLTPTEDRGIKPTKKLYEVTQTKAPAVIIEVAFHDNIFDAQWVMNNTDNIALAIAKGICKYFDVELTVKAETVKTDNVPIYIRGKKLDVPSMLTDSSGQYMTLVHLRPILEELGHKVDWKNGVVYIDD